MFYTNLKFSRGGETAAVHFDGQPAKTSKSYCVMSNDKYRFLLVCFCYTRALNLD